MTYPTEFSLMLNFKEGQTSIELPEITLSVKDMQSLLALKKGDYPYQDTMALGNVFFSALFYYDQPTNVVKVSYSMTTRDGLPVRLCRGVGTLNYDNLMANIKKELASAGIVEEATPTPAPIPKQENFHLELVKHVQVKTVEDLPEAKNAKAKGRAKTKAPETPAVAPVPESYTVGEFAIYSMAMATAVTTDTARQTLVACNGDYYKAFASLKDKNGK